MIKKMSLMAMVAFAAVIAKADFLNWQVTGVGGFTDAQLFVTGGNLESPFALGEAIAAQGVNYESVMTGNTTPGMQSTDIRGYTDAQYSFFVEMVTYSNDADVLDTKRGYTWSYNDLVSNGYISTGAIGTPSYAVGGGLNMGSSVPEPTSGILLLVGGAMLALRRRRRA